MRLLLVEDDAMNVELFADALGAEHTLVVERDGLSGLARALDEPFDLMLFDIHLPDMRGDEVCARLRAAGIRTPILAVSASAMPEEIERAMRRGFDAYLTKPIRARDLRRAIARHAARAVA